MQSSRYLINCNDMRRSRRVEPIYDELKEFFLQQENDDSGAKLHQNRLHVQYGPCVHDYVWITDPGSVIDSPALSANGWLFCNSNACINLYLMSNHLYYNGNSHVISQEWFCSPVIKYVRKSLICVYFSMIQVPSTPARRRLLSSWDRSCPSDCQTSWRKSTCCQISCWPHRPCRWCRAGKNSETNILATMLAELRWDASSCSCWLRPLCQLFFPLWHTRAHTLSVVERSSVRGRGSLLALNFSLVSHQVTWACFQEALLSSVWSALTQISQRRSPA